MRAPAHAGVLALGVLPHEEHVHVGRPAPCERTGNAREAGARVGRSPRGRAAGGWRGSIPQSETWSGTDGSPTAPIRQASCAAQDVEGVLGHHAAVLVPVGGAPGELGPLHREAQRVDDAPGLRGHLGPHPVAGEEGDAVRQAGAPTAAGTLSTNASASSSPTTSAYFAWMSNRLASCGACARSPTHSRGTSVGQPVLEQVDRRRADAAARGRAAEDHRVDALGDERRTRGSCRRSPTRPSSRSRSRPRAPRGAGRSRPSVPPSSSSPSAGTFCSQSPPSFPFAS